MKTGDAVMQEKKIMDLTLNAVWIEAYKNGTRPPNLAPNYADLPAQYKITQEEFDNLPTAGTD